MRTVRSAGIATDDDSGSGLNSSMTLSLGTATYYIGIGDYNVRAVDGDGTLWNLGSPPVDFGTLNNIENYIAVFV